MEGPGDGGTSKFLVGAPRLLLSPLLLPTRLGLSSPHTPIELLRRGKPGVAGERVSANDTWSLAKYEMDDWRRAFGDLKLRADGGGVDRPLREERGESTGDARHAGRLLSMS